MVQAHLLGEAVRCHPGDPAAIGAAYEEASLREIQPWYRAAVVQDAAARAEAARQLHLDDTGGGPGRDGADAEATVAAEAEVEDPMRALFRDGLLPALRVDRVVLRAFLRMFNLLEPPDSLLNDWDVIGRVMSVYQERDQRPPEPPLGPERLALLSALAEAT
jgi:hypothetical protein